MQSGKDKLEGKWNFADSNDINSWAEESPGTHQLFILAKIVKDLEQIESDHRHNIKSLDTGVDNIVRGLDSLSHLHLVKEMIDTKSSNAINWVNNLDMQQLLRVNSRENEPCCISQMDEQTDLSEEIVQFLHVFGNTGVNEPSVPTIFTLNLKKRKRFLT